MSRFTWAKALTGNYPLKSKRAIKMTEIKKLEAKNSLLGQRALLARELAIGYDGFNTVDGLKSLIDDMVKALNGELSFTNSKGEKIDQDEVYK